MALSYVFVPLSLAAAEAAWLAFVQEQDPSLEDAKNICFIPADGGCFLVASDPKVVAHELGPSEANPLCVTSRQLKRFVEVFEGTEARGS